MTCIQKNKKAVRFVNAVLQMADPEKKTSVDLKKLTDEVIRKNWRLLFSLGCHFEGKAENGQWICIAALKSAAISCYLSNHHRYGIITKKCLLDHSCVYYGLEPKEEQRNLAFTMD